MVDRDLTVTDDELHAYVDGELPIDRRKTVEAWLAAHPDDPARLNLARLARAERKWTRMAVAAVVCAFLVGGATGWIGRGALVSIPPAAAVTVTAEALDAHK